MEHRFAVHARAHALIAAVALASSSAYAAPKAAPAKKEFDKGVKAYSAGDYEAAAEAMGKSYQIEKDPETLFAWAQAERKLDNCDKAIELYNELLGYDLPAENKQVIQQNLGECKQLVAHKPKTTEPKTTEPKDTTPPPPVETDKADAASPPPGPTPVSAPVDKPPVDRVVYTTGDGGGAWYKDPIGDGLVLVGVGGLVFGGVKLRSAASADSDKSKAMTYPDFQRLEKKAHDDGQLGVIAAGAGGAFIALGVIWYATHRDHHEHQVTGWLAPTGGGGIALTGGF